MMIMMMSLLIVTQAFSAAHKYFRFIYWFCPDANLFNYQQDCVKRKLSVLNLLTCWKPCFSPRRSDSLHWSSQIWHSQGASGSAWPCKISRQSVPRGRTRPPKWKNTLSGKESPGANPLTIVREFYTPTYPALVFHIWRDSLHCLRSYCWATARRSFTPNFSVHPVGKTMHWIEK